MIYENSEVAFLALKKYYKLNGLPEDGGINEKWSRYKFGPIHAIAFPNFEHRRRAIERHDLHHIVNDLDTSSRGEGLIAAWELGSGCGKYWISWFMESQALWWGILLASQRMWELFLIGRKSKNYFHEDFNESLHKKTVGELRAQLLPATFKISVRLQDILWFGFFAVMGLFSMVLFFPAVFFFSIVGFLIERFWFK